MTRIEFYVEGDPKGQPRPKAFSRGGIASVYDPATAEGWKSQVALAIRPHMPSEPIQGPIYLDLEFLIARPKAHYCTGKRNRILREDAPKYVTKKPDADNYAKAVMDCLTQIRVWGDDSQVARLIVTKRYTTGIPGCRVSIAQMEDR